MRVEGSGRKKGTPNKPKNGVASLAALAAPAPVPAPAPRKRTPSKRRATAPLVVETWPLARLVQYERNPRRNDPHVERMAQAITEFGFRIPIVATSDGTIVDGHLRYKAARKLKLTQVPVALADGLTDAQIKAFRLLANKSASWASDDNDLLALELGDLRDAKFDLTLTGFDLGKISALFEEPAPPPVRRTSKIVECPKCGHAFAP